MKTRRAIIGFAAVILALIALHPPWIVHAVRYRMSFKGFPKVPPAAVVDTVTWHVPFAPLYMRHSLGLSAGEPADYEARISRGDTAAVNEWRQKIQRNEALYRVPDSLRSDWSTETPSTAPTVAYQKRFVSATFEIDVPRLSLYLLAGVAVIALVIGTAVIRGN
ncbi:MAG TPA: hypothetical protein VIF83_01440 [Gemmatimonadaceae bacterium]